MERRCSPRRAPAPHESLAHIRLRTGSHLTVLDLSDTGALVEGLTRLLPGTRLDVHVITREGRVLVRGRIVRSYVAVVRADTVVYRGGLAFEHAVDTAAAGLSTGPATVLESIPFPTSGGRQ